MLATAAAKIDSGLFRNPNRDTFANLQGIKKPDPDELSCPRQDWWWTGKPPAECPGYVDGHLTSLPLPDVSAKGSRQDILDYFDNTWTLTEVLFSGLQGEDVFKRSPWHQLRHPLIFYYGHTAVVYVNKLRVAGLIPEPMDRYLEEIMETGVDEMSWDDLGKNEMEWPSVRRVTEYRRAVYRAVRAVIEGSSWSLPVRYGEPAWAVVMGLEHERIHLETSSVLIRELPLHLVSPPPHFPPPHPSAAAAADAVAANRMKKVAGGVVELGKPWEWPSFGWDNEYGSRTVEVPDFEASEFLVTNGEFLQFVKDGGYVTSRWWTEAGAQWRAFRNVLFPTFWVPDGPVGLHRYRLRLIFEVVDLPMSWPAVVNAHEARAYCAWRSARDGPAHPYRLLSEAEHHLTRDPSCRPGTLSKKFAEAGDKWEVRRTGDPSMDYSGSEMAAEGRAANRYNLQLAWGSESPVNALPPTADGLYDTMGNVWVWTEDDFNPLDGFRVTQLYADFSEPCFDGLHTVIMGGSFISTGDEASTFSRFHFRPHFHQHAGFRMASGPSCPATTLPKRGTNGASSSSATAGGETALSTGGCSPDEFFASEERLSEYMLFHYGARADVVPWDMGATAALGFPSRMARKLIDHCSRLGVPTTRALDLGCAVGGSCFELATAFNEVMGLDLSRRFVEAAQEMKDRGQRSYKRKEEGALYTELVAAVDAAIDRQRVHFAVADACSVTSQDHGDFDAVLFANVLCRVADPGACLGAMAGLVRPGGLLFVSTACSWTEQCTHPSRWLGGKATSDGREVRTLDGIRECLQGAFDLVERCDEPMLIRETAREFRWSVVEATVWRRRTDK